MKKLNVGCGWETLEGWINIDHVERYKTKPDFVQHDIIDQDVTETWQFEDNSMDLVFSEHMIEHIPLDKNAHVFSEAFRVVKPGGACRFLAPSRTFFEDLRNNPDKDNHPFTIGYARKIFNSNTSTGMADRIIHRSLNEQGHVWVPTTEMLIKAMEDAGFTNVVACGYQESKYQDFIDAQVQDDIRPFESVVVEGYKDEADIS